MAPPKAEERTRSIEPKVAEPKVPGRATFNVDPIADSALTLMAFGTAFL